jgi:hypothetical protein
MNMRLVRYVRQKPRLLVLQKCASELSFYAGLLANPSILIAVALAAQA